MCDFTQGFKLCTCATDALPVTDAPIVYIWQLNTSPKAPEIDERVRGIYIGPLSDIGAGLSEEFVWTALNSGNCFDFDYQPVEGDNLIMRAELTPAGEVILRKWWAEQRDKKFHQVPEEFRTGRLEFTYHDGYWEIEDYNPSDYDFLGFRKGKIEPQLDS
jgi:hypothetical protein